MKSIPLPSRLHWPYVAEIRTPERLLELLHAFYRRMAEDVMIGFFFDGRDLAKIAAGQRDFLLKAWGVVESYSGPGPIAAHAALAPILKGHFHRRLVLLEESLRADGASEALIAAWVNFERAFAPGIVSAAK